jgi:hypothetical protein
VTASPDALRHELSRVPAGALGPSSNHARRWCSMTHPRQSPGLEYDPTVASPAAQVVGEWARTSIRPCGVSNEGGGEGASTLHGRTALDHTRDNCSQIPSSSHLSNRRQDRCFTLPVLRSSKGSEEQQITREPDMRMFDVRGDRNPPRSRISRGKLSLAIGMPSTGWSENCRPMSMACAAHVVEPAGRRGW